jgi:hypothetical protein
MLTYEQARNQIENGDLIFFKNSQTIVGKIIQYFGEGPYNHCAIAFWITSDNLENDRLFMVEQYAFGRRITKLSSFSTKQFDIIKAPVPWHFYCNELLNGVGKVPYSVMDYLTIFCNEKLGIKIKNFDGQVCSEMVATILKKYDIAKDLRVSPTGVVNTLISKGYPIALKVNQ